MKKILIGLLSAVVAVTAIFGFAGCNKTSNENDVNTYIFNKAEDAKTLIMYTEPTFAPFEFKDGLKVIGVDVELAKNIAKTLNMNLKVKPISFNSVIIKTGDSNLNMGVAGLSITPERAEKVDFTNDYFSATQYIVYKKGELKKDADGNFNIDNIKDKTFGVQSATTGNTILKDNNFKCKPFESILVALQDFGGGCDYAVIDEFTAKHICADSDKFECAKIVSSITKKTDDGKDVPVFAPESYAIALKKGNKELLDKINPIIKKLIDDGQIAKWIKEFEVKK